MTRLELLGLEKQRIWSDLMAVLPVQQHRLRIDADGWDRRGRFYLRVGPILRENLPHLSDACMLERFVSIRF